MTIPVVLFAYNRPEHLRQTLEGLRLSDVPHIIAFADAPKTPEAAGKVREVRDILRSVDWCEIEVNERQSNFGLGKSIVSGMTEVFARYEAAVVFEDDFVCAPGAYQYLATALNHYRDDQRIMSLAGWTHPIVAPENIGELPYFDPRAECWVWAAWRRSWPGMENPALALMGQCAAAGLDIYQIGADMPEMALEERRRNIWAVRWVYLHLLRGGLCMRPPWSLVEHIGFDSGTNATVKDSKWRGGDLRPCPPIPPQWPEPLEHPEAAARWRAACGGRPGAIKRTLKTIDALAGGIPSAIVRTLTRHGRN